MLKDDDDNNNNVCICYQRLLEKAKYANCVDQFINDLHNLIHLLSELEQIIEVAKVSFFLFTPSCHLHINAARIRLSVCMWIATPR